MSKKTYQQSTEEIMLQVGSQFNGLSEKEVSKRLGENGLNQLKEKPKKSSFQLFIETFKDAMVIILLIVAVIQLLMGAHVESIVIFAVLLLNSFVSMRR